MIFIHLKNLFACQLNYVKPIHFLSILCIGIFTSCSSLLTSLYGIHTPKAVNEKEIVKYVSKFNIPLAQSFVIDPSYKNYLSTFDTLKFKYQINNHYQPLQALYYNKEGTLVSFQINCYAGGFPNLNWNRDGAFELFPPKKQAPIDSILPLETQLKFINELPGSAKIDVLNSDFVIFVYWNKYMGRQSKRLIRYVQKNASLEKNRVMEIIYINNDNLYAGN